MNGFDYLTDANYWAGNFAVLAVFVAVIGAIAWRVVAHMRREAVKFRTEMQAEFERSQAALPPDRYPPLPQLPPPLDLGDDESADAPPTTDQPAAR